MPYLKKVKISGRDYFYLFHTVRDGNKFRKLSKYLGKKKPSDRGVEKAKKEFLSEIKKKKEKVEEKEPRHNIIAILQDLQEKKGYLPKEDMINISKELGIPGVDLYGVATFYAQFRLNKPGRDIINLCRGTACHVRGSAQLLGYFQELLGIKPGQTTIDGKITLQCVNCLGACAKAPAMMIRDITYGDLNKKKIKQIIEGLRENLNKFSLV